MTTGNHTVRDIYCVKCGQTLGWKYVRFLHSLSSLCYSPRTPLHFRGRDVVGAITECDDADMVHLRIAAFSRITHMSPRRSTKRASTSSSAICSSTYSDRRARAVLLAADAARSYTPRHVAGRTLAASKSSNSLQGLLHHVLAHRARKGAHMASTSTSDGSHTILVLRRRSPQVSLLPFPSTSIHTAWHPSHSPPPFAICATTLLGHAKGARLSSLTQRAHAA